MRYYSGVLETFSFFAGSAQISGHKKLPILGTPHWCRGRPPQIVASYVFIEGATKSEVEKFLSPKVDSMKASLFSLTACSSQRKEQNIFLKKNRVKK